MQLRLLATTAGGGWPFSILGRIGGDATFPLSLEVQNLRDFQYPRSDRRRCNHPDATFVAGYRKLSVSSVGSEAMQLLMYCPACNEDQLSVSSVGSEAMQHSRSEKGETWRIQLSVSSVGSEAMQLPVPHRPGPPAGAFQYPRSDRRRCNVGIQYTHERSTIFHTNCVCLRHYV